MGFLKSLMGRMSKDEKELYQEDHGQHSTDQKNAQQYHSPEINYDGISKTHSNTYAPPSGPPPSYQTEPPPYESWLAVPDNSSLPPPPSLGNEYSPSNNASFTSAEQGHKWCARNPIYTPSVPRSSAIIEASQQGELGFDPAPSGFRGSIQRLDNQTWEIRTDKNQEDTILTSTLPVYFAAVSNPLLESRTNHTTATFGFSITVSTLHASAGIAIGFASKPYPTFRLPGWHRGSLAVHSDDGNRYVNDPHGGIDFMRPFQIGDVVRVSMSVQPAVSPVQEYHGRIPGVMRVGTLPKCACRVQVERNGRVEGGWDVHEERDGEKDEGIEGLQGEADLYCAVGVFGMTGFVVRFESQ